MSKVMFMPSTKFNPTINVVANAVINANVNTKEAIKNLSPIEKKLYEHYKKNIQYLIHNDNSKEVQECNIITIKEANNALDAYAPHQFKQHDFAKKIAHERNPFKKEQLITQFEIYMLQIKQKVTSLLQKETIEAKNRLDALNLVDIRPKSDRVLRQATQRELYRADANKVLRNAQIREEDFTLSDDYLTLLAKESLGKKLTAGEQEYFSKLEQSEKSVLHRLNKLQKQAYNESKKYAVGMEKLRMNSAIERLKAVEYNNAIVKANGAEDDYKLIYGLPD